MGLDSPIYMPAVPMATAPMPAAPMPAQAQPETDVTQMVKRDAEALPTFEITKATPWKSFSLGFGGHGGYRHYGPYPYGGYRQYGYPYGITVLSISSIGIAH